MGYHLTQLGPTATGVTTCLTKSWLRSSYPRPHVNANSVKNECGQTKYLLHYAKVIIRMPVYHIQNHWYLWCSKFPELHYFPFHFNLVIKWSLFFYSPKQKILWFFFITNSILCLHCPFTSCSEIKHSFVVFWKID